MVLPAAACTQYIAGNQETGAGHRTVGAQDHARIVQELGFTQEPQCAACRDPVRVEILGISVAGDDAIAAVKDLVHLGHVVAVEQIVGIENEVALIACRCVFLLNALECVIERISLADLGAVEALEYDRARTFGNLCGIVGAVVRNDEYV